MWVYMCVRAQVCVCVTGVYINAGICVCGRARVGISETQARVGISETALFNIKDSIVLSQVF